MLVITHILFIVFILVLNFLAPKFIGGNIFEYLKENHIEVVREVFSNLPII